jgi:hypothetical protein
MTQNRIQFQPGMSMPEFIAQYGTEEHCAKALELVHWPAGFRSPRWGSAAHGVIQDDRAKRFQCKPCRRQASVTAGTVMEALKWPLTTWFLAIYLLGQAKMAALGPGADARLGLSYPTAWLIEPKLMKAMREREERYRFHGAVQIDDAYVGGERSGDKAGRGSENKFPFVAAVSLTEDEHPQRFKRTPVPVCTSRALWDWSRQHLAPCSTVYSDGLAFTALTMADCAHQPTVVAGRKPKDLPDFQWINTVLGNLKASLSGTYHAFAFSKYVARYRAAFAYQFNRRVELDTFPQCLLIAVVHCGRRPQHELRFAEHSC